ncbi:MAG: hypothetical protein L5655_11960 [Thermosediminibacteraceae bacterium]|nr:hypothetical protein [Thermosediminibacteraceae bacterium]
MPKANGKKPFEEEDEDDDNSNKGENSSKKVRVSTTDPESGMFQKGEKERCFAYTASVACETINFK